jgi:lipoprotein-releasing system permease protein
VTSPPSAPLFGLFERMLALRYLRAKRHQGGVALISIISFVGIALAVMALILTMSIMNGFRETLLERLLGVGGHVYVDVRGFSAVELDQIVARAERVSGVTQVAPVIEGQALATGDGFSSGVLVRGVRGQDLAQMSTVTSGLAFGGALDGFDDPEEPRVLLGARLASAVGAFEGDYVTLLSPNGAATPFGVVPRKKTFLVGGTFSTGAADYDAALVFMPLAQAQLFFGKGEGADQLDIRIANPSDPLPVKRELREALGDKVYISDWKDRNGALVTALIVERNMMRIILMVLVAITTLNIITGLVMLVKNKSRDIAILRTMGATQGAVLRIFFMSGAAIGVFGTLAGLVLGILMCVYIEPIQAFIEFVTQTRIFDPEVYQLSRLPAKIDWGEVGLVTAWALFMSFIATLPPARHASKLDPVEALRYE